MKPTKKYMGLAITIVVTWVVLLLATVTLLFLYTSKAHDYDEVYYSRVYAPGEKFSYRDKSETLYNCRVVDNYIECNIKGQE